MTDISDVLDAIMDAAKAQEEYRQARACAEDTGDVSWDWDGRYYDKLEKAKNRAREVSDSYVREIVRDQLSKKKDQP